jgi:hypothetical protein
MVVATMLKHCFLKQPLVLSQRNDASSAPYQFMRGAAKGGSL